MNAQALAAPKATKIAASIKHASGSSTVANLESRTTTEAATAGRTEGVRTGNSTNFSGQYLYDRLIGNSQEEVTKMDMVRTMVKQLDTQSFKKSITDFVDVAKGYLDNAIDAAKQAGGYDAENPPAPVQIAAARHKTAKNHQTVMRIGYGALKFCADELATFGYTDTTGYQEMRVIGLKALDSKGIKWDGSKAEDPAEKAARQATKAEGLAMAKAMEEHPRKDKEDRAAYFQRIDKVVGQILKAEQEEQHTQMIAKLVADFRAKAGALMPEVLDALLSNETQEEPEVQH